nr:olfactory receptor 52B2-like [Pelodiscus sinensis]|eukprot:XP_006116529.1 olfactory receptor 52B2-like [Pelodiscus sinensis]
MAVPNSTTFSHLTFILVGIPGLEPWHPWISIPFALMYTAAVVGNCGLLLLITTQRRLHEPMFIFLSMLAVADLLISTCTVPNTLAIFWFGPKAISFSACLTQVFFVHFGFATESGVLLAMGFDRYVAICDPLRYTTVLTNANIGKIGTAIVIKSFCLIVPFVFLLKRLPFCASNVIPHSYCEHIGVARLACADITINIWFGFSMLLLTSVLDVVFIAMSYMLILLAVFKLPTKDDWLKALSTCGSHVCIILLFYVPAFFTVLTHRFGHNVPRHIHILLANLYLLIAPVLNPFVYGMKTKQLREQMNMVWFPCSRRPDKLPPVLLCEDGFANTLESTMDLATCEQKENNIYEIEPGLAPKRSSQRPMEAPNSTTFSHLTFVLVGIPGLEPWHPWISIPFALMYMVAVVGNCGLLLLIATQRRLQALTPGTQGVIWK